MHFFIRKFWKSYSDFISDFIVVAERFLRTFVCKCFQSLGIEPSVILYIYYMVDKGKSRFLQNIVEEIRPGCRNLATKVANNGKFVGNIPGCDDA